MTIKRLCLAIAILALIIGLVRIGGGVAMLGSELGWWNLGGAFGSGVDKVRSALPGLNERALVQMSTAQYLSVMVLLGIALVMGAIQYLRGRRSGLVLLGVYVALHFLLFLNFSTLNIKILIPVAALGLWFVLRTGQRRGSYADAAGVSRPIAS